MGKKQTDFKLRRISSSQFSAVPLTYQRIMWYFNKSATPNSAYLRYYRISYLLAQRGEKDPVRATITHPVLPGSQ